MVGALSSGVYMTCICGMPKLIGDLLPELRLEYGMRTQGRKMGRAQLVREMARKGFDTTEATIKAIESTPGRVPQASFLEGVHAVFGVPLDDVYEWPIALARRESGAELSEDDPAAELERELEQDAERADTRADSSGSAVDAPDAKAKRRRGRA